MRVFVVPNFHYDIVYSYTYEEYLDKTLRNLIELLNLAEHQQGCRFLLEQTVYMEELWERFPEHRGRVRRLFQTGAAELAPGMFAMPDMMLAGGEGIIRQVERGREFAQRVGVGNFDTCWIADCWGHHRQLPQILAKCGYSNYAFSRGMTPDAAKSADFWWEGLDGSRILAHWLSQHYSGVQFPGQRLERLDPQAAEQGMERALDRMEGVVAALADVAATDAVLLPSGGDFCRPSRLNAEMVKRWNERHPDQPAALATPSEYFDAVAQQAEQVPVVSEDFNPLFQGTYTTRIDVKQNIRWGEHAMYASELLDAITRARTGASGSRDARHRRAVEILLYNQFHDTICGTIYTDAYRQDIALKCREMTRLFEEEMAEDLDALVAAVANDGDDTWLAVFNPLPFARREVVNASVSFCEDGVRGLDLFDDEGRPVAGQVEPREEWRGDALDLTQAKVRFVADLPSGGLRFYRVEGTKQPRAPEQWRALDGPHQWHDGNFSVEIGTNGCITSLRLAPDDLELVDPALPAFNDVKFQLDQGDAWGLYEAPINAGAGIITPVHAPYVDHREDRSRSAVYAARSPAKVSVLETEAVTIVKAEQEVAFWARRWALTRYVYLYPGLGRIDFRTEFVPDGRHYRLLACFPTTIREGSIQQEIAFGSEQRGEGEYPTQNWMAYEDDEKGLLLLNRGLPGNNVTDGVMMLSLFRAVDLGPHHYASRDMYYEGEPQAFEYSLVPFAGRGKRGEVGAQALTPARWGSGYNVPPRARAYGVAQPHAQSWVSLTPGNVRLTALRRTDAGLLVRVYETQGKATRFALKLGLPMSQAVETDCLGRSVNRRVKRVKDGTLSGAIAAFEIKTFVAH